MSEDVRVMYTPHEKPSESHGIGLDWVKVPELALSTRKAKCELLVIKV